MSAVLRCARSSYYDDSGTLPFSFGKSDIPYASALVGGGGDVE